MNPNALAQLGTPTDKHIYISIWLPLKGWTPAGVITFNDGMGYAGFSYFESYMLANHPPLNPATLNYREQNSRHFIVDPKINSHMLDRTFWELLPSQGDFGHQALMSRFPQYVGLNHAQKLYFLGNRTVGGLASYVKKHEEEVSIDSLDWLDDTRRDAVAFHLREVARLHQNANAFMAMTSYGGVRPKAMYKDEAGKFWIAKFNLETDPYDMAKAEHVAMVMAKECGMRVPDTKVLQLSSGQNVFLTERFDRQGKERLHSLALYSLVPGIDTPKQNGSIIKGNSSKVMATLIKRYSDFKDKDTVDLIVKLLIDIGFNNTDNHLRNTRMILNKEGLWELSPMFDVLFNPRSQPHVYNPAGLELAQTSLTSDKLVEGLSTQIEVEKEKVEPLLLKVSTVVKDYEKYCDIAGITQEDKARISAAINLGLSRQELDYRIQLEARRKLEQTLRTNRPKPKSF